MTRFDVLAEAYYFATAKIKGNTKVILVTSFSYESNHYIG